MKYRSLLSCAVWCCISLFAHSAHADIRSSDPIIQHISAYEEGYVGALDVDALLVSEATSVKLPVGSEVLDIRLEPFDIVTEHATIVTVKHGEETNIEVVPPTCLTGTVVGDPSSLVVLTISDEFVLGQVSYQSADGATTVQISKAADVKHPDGVHSDNLVFIKEVQASDAELFTPYCGSENVEGFADLSDDFVATSMVSQSKIRDEISQSEMLEFNIALDCDINYLSDHGNNISRAATYALSVMAGVSAVYQRDLNTRIRVSYLRQWIDEDPYPGRNTSQLLPQVRNYWNANMRHVDRGLTQMMSGINGIGGIAYLNGMCNNNGYSVAGLNNNVTFPASSYVWDIMVSAHELGHNVGANHTHNCNWSPPIDSCVSAEGSCYSGTKPRRGTIMSYCHLTSSGISPFFHPKIRTAMRAKLEEDECVYPAFEEHDVDIVILDIEYPINGMKVLVGEEVIPRVSVVNTGLEESASFRLKMNVENQESEVLASHELEVPSLPVGEVRIVPIGTFTPSTTDTYTVTIETVETVDDGNQLNNSMTRVFHSVEEIESEVTLLQPSAAGSYVAGDIIQFEWDSEGVSEVALSYSIDNGATWRDVRNRLGAQSAGYHWTVPSVDSDQVRFKIHDKYSSGVVDVTPFTSTFANPFDVAIGDVISPLTGPALVAPFTPSVVVRNVGSQNAENVSVRMRLVNYDSWEEIVSETKEIGQLQVGEQQEVSFADIGPEGQGMNNLMYFRVFADGDLNDQNDSVGIHVRVQEALPRRASLIEPAFSETGVDRMPFFLWSDIGEASSYDLQVARNSNFAFLSIDLREVTTEPNIVSNVVLEPSTKYYWRVRTSNSRGSADWSDVFEFTTGAITSVNEVEASSVQTFVSSDLSELVVNNVRMEQVHISVVAIDGSVVVNTHVEPGKSFISLSDLSSGAYFVVVNGTKRNGFTVTR